MERKINIESLNEVLSYFYSNVFDEDFVVKIVSEIKNVNYDFSINNLEEILVDLELHIYFADTENFYIIKKLTQENADRISNMLIENNVDLKINEDNSLKLFINKKKVNVLKKNQ